MNKKGSMELSVNSIVILVIAIVMMGLILGFVKTRFTAMDRQIIIEEPNAPVATLSEPVTMSRSSLVIGSGDKIGLKFQVYALRAITDVDKPFITCTETGAPTFTITTNGKTALIDTVIQYEGLVKASNSAKGKYICSLSFGLNAADASFSALGTGPVYTKDLIVEIQ